MAKIEYISKANVVGHREVFEGHYETRFEEQYIAKNAAPGNFVAIRHERGALLPRPFSIADVNNDCFSVIYKVIGQGTLALANYREGDTISIKGPIGEGLFSFDDCYNPLLVGGGVGIAALNLLARRLVENGKETKMLIGAIDKSLLPAPYLEQWSDMGIDVAFSTDDGSSGYEGRVTELMDESLRDNASDKVFVAGPKPMIREAVRISMEHGVSGQAAMEAMMACGMGTCQGCVIKIKTDDQGDWEYKRVCKEGPVFDIDKLVFD